MDNKAFSELKEVAARSFGYRDRDLQAIALENLCYALDAIMEAAGPEIIFSYEVDEKDPESVVIRTSVYIDIAVNEDGRVDITNRSLATTKTIFEPTQNDLVELVKNVSDLAKPAGKNGAQAGGRHRKPESDGRHSRPAC